MNKRLTHVSPLQLGIVLAVVSGLLSLVFVLPMVGIASLVGTLGHQNAGMPPIFAGIFCLLLPVFYAVFGFIGGVLGGFIYNLVVKLTGGIEFTTEDAPQE